MPYLTDMFHDQNRRGPEPSENGTDGADGSEKRPPGSFDPAAAAEKLRGRVLGQDTAVDAVVRALTLAKAGAQDPDRPPANLLLIGPTGVGKTELVRQVAALLRSGPDDLCRVDMNSLAQEHYAASFSGAPPGYAGAKEAYSLFDRSTVEGDPYTPGIVLFDEVEKAHPTVLRALLQVLDTGILRLANGQEKISFRNCFVFLTSNLGSAELARRRAAPWRRAADRLGLGLGALSAETVVDRALRDFFDPEFLNRIDETVVFGEIDRPTARRIAALEIELLSRRLRRRSIQLDVTDDVVDLLGEKGFDPVYGARGLRRALRTLVASPVAGEVLKHSPGQGSPLSIAVRVSGGVVTTRAAPPGES
ncbi:AAA family ATPase [Amycolatopsis sp. NPDC059021]|uniref:AAA family ATPase n=1 Tax=Amycolatopsis sp. NPDC059021 TaxID=3346704 RepID=UPI003671334B